jgi:YesN/AraC family two-component response regulator
MKYIKCNIERPIKFIFAGKSSLTASWQHVERIMPDYELMIVLDGNLFMEQDGVKYSCKKGDVLFQKTGIMHRGYKPSMSSFYWLHFMLNQYEIIEENNLEEKILNLDNNKQIIFPLYFAPKEVNKLVTLSSELISSMREMHPHILNNYLMSSILIELSKQFLDIYKDNTLGNKRFQEIFAYIKAHYDETITVKSIAEKFDYNEKYLPRLFKKYTNQTIKEYVIQLKLNEAKKLLMDTNDSIKEIAKILCFEDTHYFMRLFKKKMGITPTEFRNSYGQMFFSSH